jgi:ribosomal protein L28
MAEKICTICEKKSAMSVTLVKLRGKYNPTSKVRKYPNLQWVRLSSGKNAGKRVLACAKCIKRMAKI